MPTRAGEERDAGLSSRRHALHGDSGLIGMHPVRVRFRATRGYPLAGDESLRRRIEISVHRQADDFRSQLVAYGDAALPERVPGM